MVKKKAVSPVVSTTLLILIVLVLAAIIIVWSRGFIKEAITKNIGGDSKTVENLCNQLSITPIVNPDGTFGFSNNGNVPIYDYNIKLSGGGSSSTLRGGNHLNPGVMVMVNGTDLYSSYSEVKIIPILLGKTKNGITQEFTCPEQNGFVL